MLPAIRSALNDPAIRYGIKFGLAGILAVFIALTLRLQEPTWALFTVFVLMIAQYVGAIAQKSIFRIIGTVVGGILGYLLTAGLEQNPVAFILLVSLAVGLCTALFGQSRYPYAFFLCALTIVVVVSNGMANPDFSWQFALWRIEEVTLGILVTMLVQCLLWPRFARKEFMDNTRAALADLRSCLHDSAEGVFVGDCGAAAARAGQFPNRISALRGLLDFGARESQYFRDRLPTYFEITTCLSRVAANLATMATPLPANSYYHTHLRSECSAVHLSLEEALADLADRRSTTASRARHREKISAARQALEARLLALHEDPALRAVSPEAATAFGLHRLALEEILDAILRIQSLLDSLPDGWSARTRREPHPYVSPFPPPFWIRAGLKSALAVGASLLLFNWLHPPGGPVLVLGAWVFTTLNATSPGGRGDRRAFHYLIFTIVALLGICLALLAIRPLLSSYAVMNTLIFSWLFLWGFLSYQTRGVTIPMQMAMLLIVSILGLNAQEPVPVQAVADIFFGLAFALLLAALIQRLVRPSLPQWEVRDRLVELLHLLRKGLRQPLPLWEQVRLALIPGESTLRIAHLHRPFCTEEDQQHLRTYLANLHQISTLLLVSRGRLAALTASGNNPEAATRIATLEREIQRHLRAHESGLKNATPPAIHPGPLHQLLTAWIDWIGTTRQQMLQQNRPGSEVTRFVGLAGRHAESVRALLLAGQQARTLRLKNYMGDFVL